jgi:hypothetical protein
VSRPVRCLWMLQLHGVVTEGQVSAAACARSGCGCVVASALLWLPLATITMARAAKTEASALEIDLTSSASGRLHEPNSQGVED